MRFDWYQATFDVPAQQVLDTISKLGKEVVQNDKRARMMHYQNGFEVHGDAGLAAFIAVGGNGGKPHALASSDATDAFVDLVRNEWPDNHLVTRMDAAQDFYDPSAFEKLRRVTRRAAKEHKLAFPRIEDVLDKSAGRTQYVGSAKSDYRARLYEKGLEVFSKLKGLRGISPDSFSVVNPETGEDIKASDWVRLELQIRPRKEAARRAAAALSPEDAWSVSDWSHQIATEALQLDIERIFLRARKQSTDEATFNWMCTQYERVLLRMAHEFGGWDHLGEHIGATIENRLKHKN